ncbi:hypothetical protein HDU82_005702 [Entophlyctis luteolus]|nr:hypothetical protein HDU82_005702 [Entophlyctis luteolus]
MSAEDPEAPASDEFESTSQLGTMHSRPDGIETASILSRISEIYHVVASLNLRYAEKDLIYFDEQMPPDMEGLIPVVVYSQRISSLNKRLQQAATIRDYMPIVRLFILLAFLVFSFVFVATSSAMPMVFVWTASFGALVLVFLLLSMTYYKPSFERWIEQALAEFSSQDENIQLVWSSVRATKMRPFFPMHFSARGWEVPWRITVTHINKTGDGAFLPAYASQAHSPSILDLEILSGGPTRPPSYRSRM